jgi:hypothetical protein
MERGEKDEQVPLSNSVGEGDLGGEAVLGEAQGILKRLPFKVFGVVGIVMFFAVQFFQNRPVGYNAG